MGSDADPFPWYSVDLTASAFVSDVQLWFDASGDAWPDGGVNVYVQSEPWSGNTSGAEAAPCFAWPPGSPFSASVQGVCNVTGQYVTVQLAGPTTPAVAADGPSTSVLRLCALFAYGHLFAPPPPAAPHRQGPVSADQSRDISLAVIMPIAGCALLYMAFRHRLYTARRLKAEAAEDAAERARAPAPLWPTHSVRWMVHLASAGEKGEMGGVQLSEKGPPSPAPTPEGTPWREAGEEAPAAAPGPTPARSPWRPAWRPESIPSDFRSSRSALR